MVRGGVERPAPADFAEVFVRLGREGSRRHYQVGCWTIDRWLRECGKARLIRKRAAVVARTSRTAPVRPKPADFAALLSSIGPAAAQRHYGTGWRQIRRWRAEVEAERLALIGLSLQHAFPLPEAHDPVSYSLARRAADHLRIVRNGGWVVTHASGGNWRVGTRVLTPSELVSLAVAKGFEASVLTADAAERLGMGR